jgi:DNA-binding response OmpR family regulator/DNA-binding CsgD family transcriptional regulator
MNMPIEERHQVMIVDDTPANLAFLSDALADAGYEVLVALSGHTALRQLELVKPDVILLDAVMPGMDGFETCERLKAREDTREIPVIFMTALTATADVVRGFDHGAVDYVTKPVREAEILARIATHIGRSRELRRAQGTVEAWPRPSLTVTTDGVITTASSRARMRLAALAIEQRLPAVCVAWLAAQVRGAETASPFTLSEGAGALTMEFCGAVDAGEYLLLLDHAQAASATRLIDSHGLTAREAQVMEWVTAGKTNRDIALILDISPRTVTKHLERIFVKLGVETRTAAVGRVLAGSRGE